MSRSGVLKLCGCNRRKNMISCEQQIGIFMCKGETNETTCDRYAKRNNR